MAGSIFRKKLFAGRTVLVTGGGGGIGLRTARELSSLGATVILCGRVKEKLAEARDRIQRDNGKVWAVPCDIRDEEQVRECIKRIVETEGRLDGLVNNAGGQFPAPAEDISSKGWEAVVETNLNGTFMMCREAFRQSMREHGGVIVNVLVNFWNGFPFLAHTGAARAGVDNLTKTLATEWGRYGVRVNAVAPGVIDSSGLDHYTPEFRKRAYDTARFNQTSRLGAESEVSSTIVFLLNPENTYLTGVTLRIDGGESLYHPLHPPVEHDRLRAHPDEEDASH